MAIWGNGKRPSLAQGSDQLKPDYGGAYFNLGFAYLKSGNKNGAIEQYKMLQPLNLGLANSFMFIATTDSAGAGGSSLEFSSRLSCRGEN